MRLALSFVDLVFFDMLNIPLVFFFYLTTTKKKPFSTLPFSLPPFFSRLSVCLRRIEMEVAPKLMTAREPQQLKARIETARLKGDRSKRACLFFYISYWQMAPKGQTVTAVCAKVSFFSFSVENVATTLAATAD